MTDNAGYCMAVTAKRNNMRLLAIVLGEENGKVRNQETAELLDYGFNLYEMETIQKKGDILGTTKLDKASKKEISFVASKDVTVLKKRGEESKKYKSDLNINQLTLPIKKGDQIGELTILDDYGNKINKVSIISLDDVQKDNFINIYLKIILSFINGELI